MKTIKDYLTEAKELLKLDNDNQLANYLNWQPQSITKINDGKSINDINAERLARALRRKPIEIIATSHMQRAKNNKIRRIWEKLAKENGNNQ